MKIFFALTVILGGLGGLLAFKDCSSVNTETKPVWWGWFRPSTSLSDFREWLCNMRPDCWWNASHGLCSTIFTYPEEEEFEGRRKDKGK